MEYKWHQLSNQEKWTLELHLKLYSKIFCHSIILTLEKPEILFLN